MMEAQDEIAPRKTASLMISYSRKDKVFVKQFYDCLVANGFAPKDIWVDWEGIPLSADWMAEITKGIQSADAFIFIISPDSVTSEVCAKEIEIAVDSNKRFIPILHREPGKGAPLHAKVSSHNWVFVRDQEELDKTLPALIDAINTDLDWIAQHTRLFNRAKEWEAKSRNDSYLVRGNDLQDALTFISQGAAGKEPAPTPLHIEYVQAANKYAAHIRRRNRMIAAAVGIALFLLAIVAVAQAVRATINEGVAVDNYNNAQTQQVRAELGEAEAQAQRGTAQANEALANQNARVANALALASASIIEKDHDTQLSLMLALLSIQQTQHDQFVLAESQSALFSSLNVPNVLYTLPKQDNWVRAVALDDTGVYLATGTRSGTVSIWTAQDGKLAHTLKEDGQIRAMDFSPDGTQLGIASDYWDDNILKNHVNVWDVKTGQKLFTLAGHDGVVFDIAYSPDGKYIATAGQDGTIKLWFANGALRVTLYNNQSPVRAVAFSPDSTLLVSGGSDHNAVLWDVGTASLLRTLRGHTSPVLSVAFNPWGSNVITGSSDLTAIIWNVADGTKLNTLAGNYSSIHAVDYAPDGLSILTAASGVKIWDYYYATQRFNLTSHRGEILDAAYSHDGRYIFTGSSDGTAKLWTNYLMIDTLKMKQNVGPNYDAAYSQDGKWIVTTDGWGNILVHDASTGDVTQTWQIKDIEINSASFDPRDSQRIVTGDSSGQVTVWTQGNGEPVLTIKAHDDAVNSVIYSLDGTRILSAADDGTAKIWNAEDGTLELTLANDDGSAMLEARFSDDGSRIVTSSTTNNLAEIWDAQTGKSLVKLTGHTDYVDAAVFSHDGSKVYTASDDNTLKVWDASTGKQLQNLTGHTGFVNSLDLSPDGKLLVSGSSDTTVKVWNLSDGKLLYNYLGNNEQTNSVMFNHDGTKILTASDDETSKEFTIDYNDLLAISQQYELRPLTEEQCQRFLYQDNCTLTLFGQTAPSSEASPSPMVQATSTPVQVSLQASATPTPIPAGSNPAGYFTEEFDGNLNGWDSFMVTGLEEQVKTRLDSGSLFVNLSPREDKIPRFYLLYAGADYTAVQLDLRMANHGNNANGVSLVCNYEGNHWYEFTISNGGLYSISVHDPAATASQGYVELAGGGTPLVKGGHTVNDVQAICKGNELTLSVNGNLVKTLVDTKYNLATGKIGLAFSSPQRLPVEVSVDTLRVSEP